ncbi:hypothetical protein SUGI_1168500 [Cryptomeria japonica]|nr:hypothetical protein SUGI_1168500 [Cryptomeria japonica]
MASETFSLKRRASASSGSEAIPHIAFGCGNQQEGDFGGAAGLVGVGRGVLCLVSQLGETIKHKFSYCLGSVEDESGVSPLFLGDAPIADLPGKFQSTPFMGVNDFEQEWLCLAYSNAGLKGSLSVFGNTQQQNYNIIYDLGKTKLSFAPAICDNL